MKKLTKQDFVKTYSNINTTAGKKLFNRLPPNLRKARVRRMVKEFCLEGNGTEVIWSIITDGIVEEGMVDKLATKLCKQPKKLRDLIRLALISPLFAKEFRKFIKLQEGMGSNRLMNYNTKPSTLDISKVKHSSEVDTEKNVGLTFDSNDEGESTEAMLYAVEKMLKDLPKEDAKTILRVVKKLQNKIKDENQLTEMLFEITLTAIQEK